MIEKRQAELLIIVDDSFVKVTPENSLSFEMTSESPERPILMDNLLWLQLEHHIPREWTCYFTCDRTATISNLLDKPGIMRLQITQTKLYRYWFACYITGEVDPEDRSILRMKISLSGNPLKETKDLMIEV